MGISMDLLTLQKDELLKNILELINNEKYVSIKKKHLIPKIVNHFAAYNYYYGR